MPARYRPSLRWLLVFGLVPFVLASLGVTCTIGESDSDEPKTFDRHDVSFTYPGGWKRFSDV